LGDIAGLPAGHDLQRTLLDTTITIRLDKDGELSAWEGTNSYGRGLPIRQQFGYLWTSLGTPTREVFDIPEFNHPGRRNIHAGSIGVHTSAPRAVENFLDLGHFAFVHRDYLGVEPFTEIKPYRVRVADDNTEIVATQCYAYQPVAALGATEGYEAEYLYRVPHPYCALLYKSVSADDARIDIIGLFLQPITEERVVAHMQLSTLDSLHSDAAIREFQQFIFSQDKPILENQVPKRLPLDIRTEISARADATSTAYRRWLLSHGVRYGTIQSELAQE